MEQFLVAGGDFIAVDPNPAVGAGEFDAVALAVLVDDGPERTVIHGGFDNLRHTVRPIERRFKLAGCGVTVGKGRGDDPGFDADRAVQTDAPAGDIVMMRAPIGDGAARIGKPPAEGAVAAFGVILRGGSLAEPEVVIEPVPDGNFLERTAANARRHEDVDLLQGADAPVADEFAGEAEPFAAALLRAGLENDFIIADGFDDVMAFVNGQRQRFFAMDIFFGPRGGDVDERVPVIRGCLADGGNVIAFEQFPEVIIFVRCATVVGETLRGLIGILLIHIADGQDIAKARGVLRVALALAAATDQRETRTVIRTGNIGADSTGD